MSSSKRMDELADKWLNGSATPEEVAELGKWLEQVPDGPVTLSPDRSAASIDALRERMLLNVNNQIQQTTATRQLSRWLPYAAAALIIITVGAWWQWGRPADKKPLVAHITQSDTDVAPGSEKATLLLADGSKIQLDPAKNGQLHSTGQVMIDQQNGMVNYRVTGNGNNARATLNTMQTGRGGTYRLQLPDGTRVWLNAASSITFPTAFTGSQRKVSVTGEVYFEVVKNKSQPFMVQARQQDITVLGTHFNVNAYEDEPATVTTLVEGAVHVNEKLLRPGQLCSNNVVAAADVGQAVAWKEGTLSFKKTDIVTMMRQVSRWYDVDIVYKGIDTKRTFTAEVPRTVNLSVLLQLLSVMEIHYSLDPAKKQLILHP